MQRLKNKVLRRFKDLKGLRNVFGNGFLDCVIAQDFLGAKQLSCLISKVFVKQKFRKDAFNCEPSTALGADWSEDRLKPPVQIIQKSLTIQATERIKKSCKACNSQRSRLRR